MWYSSTKIDFILNTLESIRQEFDQNPIEAKEKFGNILIFSQWTEMLHDIGVCCFIVIDLISIDCIEKE